MKITERRLAGPPLPRRGVEERVRLISWGNNFDEILFRLKILGIEPEKPGFVLQDRRKIARILQTVVVNRLLLVNGAY